MKLHLPVNLFRAVMALFAAPLALTAAWAEDSAQISTTTYTIESDVTYGGGDGQTAWEGEKAQWNLPDDVENVTFTSSQNRECTVIFDGTAGAFDGNEDVGYTAIVGNAVTFEKLDEIKFTGFEDNSYAVHSESLSIQNNNKVSIVDNAGNTNIYSGSIAFSDNGQIDMSGNEVITRAIYDENGTLVDYGGALRGGVIYGSSYYWTGDEFVSMHNNGEVKFSQNKLVTDAYEAYGAAIYSEGPVTLAENTKVVFDGNSAESCYIDESKWNGYNPSRYHANACGGAIYADYWSEDEEPVDGVSIINNESVEFKNNTAVAGMDASGGAIHNQGAGTLLSGNDSLTFTDNKAESTRDGYVYGGAIASRSKLTITGNGNILFDSNTVSSVGGIAMGSAITVEEGGVFIDDNTGTITVSNNGTTTYGVYYGKDGTQYGGGALASGAIVSMQAALSLSRNEGAITFSGNYIRELTGTADAPFDFNGSTTASGGGLLAGAAVGVAASVAINENKKDILFTSNNITAQSSSVFGGSIANIMGDITFCANEGNIEFTDNSVSTSAFGYAWGGAIATCATLADLIGAGTGSVQSSVVFKGNKDISFSGNEATSELYQSAGGAVFSSNDVSMSNNSAVSFEGNTVNGGDYAAGGAIAALGKITVSGGDVDFTGNKVITTSGLAKGGAIAADNSMMVDLYMQMDPSLDREAVTDAVNQLYPNSITISGNGDVTFSKNSVVSTNDTAYGGAIFSNGDVTLTGNNGVVKFSQNTAYSENGHAYAAAICVNGGNIQITHNAGGVALTDNTSISHGQVLGGGVFTIGDIDISHNGAVSITGNIAVSLDSSKTGDTGGGALFAFFGKVSLSHNMGDVTIINNGAGSMSESAKIFGGAIMATSGFSVANNSGDVTFAGNFELQNKTLRLHSVYAGGGDLELAAADGKSIVFYDALTVTQEVNVGDTENAVLNSYKDADGNAQTSTGDIIFSGQRVTSDLEAIHTYVSEQLGVSDIKCDYEASRTSSIERHVTVAAGSLQVKDSAILKVIDLSIDNGAKLLIGGDSGIVADFVTVDDGAELSVLGIADASSLNMREVAIPAPAVIEANTVTLTAGMTYTMEGTFAYMAGTGDVLNLDIANGKSFTFNFDERLSYADGDTVYYILFAGVDELRINGITEGVDLSLVQFNDNDGDYELGYMVHETVGGVLYVKATIPEPTTATLSLLALAALAARRRRR